MALETYAKQLEATGKYESVRVYPEEEVVVALCEVAETHEFKNGGLARITITPR